MTVPSFSAIERAIRSAWSGDVPAAREIVDDDGLREGLELLAHAPLAYKNVQANGVRAAWVRAGGVTPVVAAGGLGNPLGRASAWPHR